MKRFNFLIAEDHGIYRKGLIKMLEDSGLAKSIVVATNGKEAIEQFKGTEIDLILMDYSMPVLNGYEASKIILRGKRKVKVIMLTQYDELPIILNAFKIGITGFLNKLSDEKEMIDAIRSVASGDYYFNSKFDTQINQWIKGGLDKNIPSIQFSVREIQIVTLMSRGKTSQEIASELGIKARTIETYRYDLIQKVQVKNASELISYVYRNGLI